MPVYAINKKGRFNYTFLENLEVGIVLSGAEVKSIKQNRVNFQGAYVSYENSELWLKQTHISPYQEKNQPGYNPDRIRKLILKRKEIDRLMGKIKSEGLTIIPEKVYSKGGLIKVQICLARGKKQYDKRAVIKKRESQRNIKRALKGMSHNR